MDAETIKYICIGAVLLSLVVSALVVIYSISGDKNEIVTLDSNEDYNNRVYSSRKKGELRNGKKRAAVQNNRRKQQKAKSGADRAGSVVNLRSDGKDE